MGFPRGTKRHREDSADGRDNNSTGNIGGDSVEDLCRRFRLLSLMDGKPA